MPFGFLFVLIAESIALFAFMVAVSRAPDMGSLQRMHFLLLGVELVCHSAMVYYLGGVSWLGSVAYIYALMYAAVFLSLPQAAAFTAVVAAAYLAVVSLDASGTIPHQWYLPQGPDRYKDPEFLVTTSLAFIGVLATITFWMVFIGQELRKERDVAIRANHELLKTQEELRMLNEELEKKVEERTRALAWRAEHDVLTGLLNRDAISRRCQELLALARRGGRPFSIVVADGDNFKVCNDTGGHGYGDEVLRTTAECLRLSCRESDVVGRLGGDEFLVVLPDTNVRGALKFCKRLLREVERQREAWHLRGPDLPTVSLGVAVFPDYGSDVDELIRIADRAMYDAKAAGGNRASVGSAGVTFVTAHRERPRDA
jgi:diguanylate cyclase (GGDEF)-like protein